MNTKMHWQG